VQLLAHHWIDGHQILKYVFKLGGIVNKLVLVEWRTLIDDVVIFFWIKDVVFILFLFDRLHNESHVTVTKVDDSIHKDLTVSLTIESEPVLVTESFPQIVVLVCFLNDFLLLRYYIESFRGTTHFWEVNGIFTLRNKGGTRCIPEYLWSLMMVKSINLIIIFDIPYKGAVQNFRLPNDNNDDLLGGTCDNFSYLCILLIWINVELKFRHLLIKWFDLEPPCFLHIPEVDIFSVHTKT